MLPLKCEEIGCVCPGNTLIVCANAPWGEKQKKQRKEENYITPYVYCTHALRDKACIRVIRIYVHTRCKFCGLPRACNNVRARGDIDFGLAVFIAEETAAPSAPDWR